MLSFCHLLPLMKATDADAGIVAARMCVIVQSGCSKRRHE
jgi:hypothetical protein